MPHHQHCLQFYFRQYGGHTIWFDNLFIKMDRSSASSATLLFWQPKTKSQLWMTDMTFECDNELMSRGVYMQDGFEAYCQGVLLLSNGSHCVPTWHWAGTVCARRGSHEGRQALAAWVHAVDNAPCRPCSNSKMSAVSTSAPLAVLHQTSIALRQKAQLTGAAAPCRLHLRAVQQ